MTRRFKSIDTQVVHEGEPQPRIEHAVAMPIFQSSTYVYGGETSYDALGYARLNNTPNHEVLHAKLASLENAEAALVTSSGMSAITTAILAICGAGDHMLMLDSPYGGTRSFAVEDLPRLGIGVSFIDGDKPESWATQLQPGTRAIYVESISNPLMQVPDLEAVVEFAQKHNLVSMIDNTFTSPVNFRPAEIGFDLSLHSATKYLNGHDDLIAGAVIGRKDLVDKTLHLLNHLGGCLDPHACFLLHRGIKTLGLRVRKQNDSALCISKFLEAHDKVESVNYPGLESHPDHERAKRLFNGCGGMLSFTLAGDHEAADAFMSRLMIPLVAVSLGGVDSLIIRPATTAYASTPKAKREALGITDGLIRLSVGTEGVEDLIEDLLQALESYAQ